MCQSCLSDKFAEWIVNKFIESLANHVSVSDEGIQQFIIYKLMTNVSIMFSIERDLLSQITWFCEAILLNFTIHSSDFWMFSNILKCHCCFLPFFIQLKFYNLFYQISFLKCKFMEILVFNQKPEIIYFSLYRFKLKSILINWQIDGWEW